jgi:hypothetical protein
MVCIKGKTTWRGRVKPIYLILVRIERIDKKKSADEFLMGRGLRFKMLNLGLTLFSLRLKTYILSSNTADTKFSPSTAVSQSSFYVHKTKKNDVPK